MTKAYLNYPNAHFTAHRSDSCGSIRSMGKRDQRVLHIDVANLSNELSRFMEGQHRFASSSATNDMWLELSLGDQLFELAVLEFIHRRLADRYQPFSSVQVAVHC